MTKTKKSRLPAGVSVLKDGRYHARATATDPATGRRVYRKRTLPEGATLAEAVAALEELRSGALEVAQEAEAKPEEETVLAFGLRWLGRKGRRWRPQTAKTTVRRMERAILPWWGEVRVCDVSRRAVLEWRDHLQDQIGDAEGQLSQATILGIWHVGLSLIRAALDEHELRDCTRGVEVPIGRATPRREAQTLAAEEIEQLACAMQGLTIHWIVFALAAYTGCRLGEALALRWCDVDLDRGIIHVRRNYALTISGEPQFGPPKNGKARTCGLAGPLRGLLARHFEAAPGVGEALIARTTTGRPPNTSTLHRALRRARVACGIEQRVTFQVLRRSWITLAIAAGVDHELMRESVGHADAAMTRVYHAPREESLRGVADAMWPASVARE